ncbi:hypothetical protein OAO87_01930 [bacterium]|nr:hypothetical protein [bacterium]
MSSLQLSYLPMVVFLAFGLAANLPFFMRSLFDAFLGRALKTAMPSAPPALLTTAFAELCWVLPCLLQCAMLLSGSNELQPASSKVGCDVMGWYSVFGSLSGMTSTLWVAFVTRSTVLGKPPSARASSIASVGVILGSVFVTCLPLMGVGQFAFTGCVRHRHGGGWSALMTDHCHVTAPPQRGLLLL